MAVASGIVVGTVVFNLLPAIFPFAFRTAVELVSELGDGGVPAAIVVFAVPAGTVGRLQVLSSAANANDIANVTNLLASAHANPPDLAGFLKDPTGMFKLTSTLTAPILPDFPSTQHPPTQDTDPIFSTSGQSPDLQELARLSQLGAVAATSYFPAQNSFFGCDMSTGARCQK